MQSTVHQKSLSGARLLSLAVGVGGFAIALIGASMRFVTAGGSVLFLNTSASISLENVDQGAKNAVVAACVVGIATLILAQIPYLRSVAIFALLGSVGLLWAAIYALDRANERGLSVRGVVTALANPRPAAGFYAMVAGAIAAGVGSLVTLIARRNTVVFAPIVVTQPMMSGSPALQQSVRTARGQSVPLPDRTPGWHADPLGSGRLRWWDGRYWAPEPMTSCELPRPDERAPTH